MLLVLLICLTHSTAIHCMESGRKQEKTDIALEDVVQCDDLYVNVQVPRMNAAVWGGEDSIAKFYGVILKHNKQFIVYDPRKGFRNISSYVRNAIWSGIGMVVSFFLAKKCFDFVAKPCHQVNLESLGQNFICLGALCMLFCGVNAYLGFDTFRAWRKYKRTLLQGVRLRNEEVILQIKSKKYYEADSEFWIKELDGFKWELGHGNQVVETNTEGLDLYCSEEHRFRQRLKIFDEVSHRVCLLLDNIQEEDLKQNNIQLKDLLDWNNVEKQYNVERNCTPQWVTDIFNGTGNDFSFISTVPYSYYTWLYIKTKWGILSANPALENALKNLVWRLHYSRVQTPLRPPDYACQLTEFKKLLKLANVFENADDSVTIENLSESWVKKRFKRASLKFHPDKTQNMQATDRFQLLNNVNNSLMDFFKQRTIRARSQVY